MTTIPFIFIVKSENFLHKNCEIDQYALIEQSILQIMQKAFNTRVFCLKFFEPNNGSV